MTRNQALAARAADILEQRGHCKNRLVDLGGRVCAHGALNIADHGTHEYAGRYPQVFECDQEICAHSDMDSLVPWNNAPERTAQEVIDAFRSFANYKVPVAHGAHDGELVA